MNAPKKNTSEDIKTTVELNIERLKKIVLEIENLGREKKNLDIQIAALYSTAELMGFSKKILRQVLSKKQKTIDEIEEEEVAFEYLWQILS